MRLRKIEVSEGHSRKGLNDIRMHRLGQVVALLGPNGAGKSRLLRMVEGILREDIRFTNDSKSAPKLLGRDEDVYQHEARIAEWYSVPPTTASLLVRLEPDLEALGTHGTITSFDIASSVANHLSLLHKPANGQSVSAGVIPFFHLLAQAACNEGNSQISGPQQEHRVLLFRLARELTQKLLRTDLGFSYRDTWADVVPTLGGRQMNPAELSAGQRVLLYYIACLLAETAARPLNSRDLCLKGAVIILDEPELHLHPAAFVGIIEGFREIVGETGQIWVASHASALLSNLAQSECWLMSDGEVIAPSSESFVQGFELLMGSPEAVEKLREKVQESALWAAAAFAAQCLLVPSQVSYRDNDPQLLLVGQTLQARMAAGIRVVIVDYGAGKGRFAQYLRSESEEVNAKIEYVPVEPRDELRTDIVQASGPLLSPLGVLPDISEVHAHYSHGVDVVVLCNVLHEISPDLWPNTLNTLLDCLRDKGALLICEDLMMPFGELPSGLGFFVLAVNELQTLFALRGLPQSVVHENPRYRDRLLCVEIPKCGAHVTRESVVASLEELKARTLGQLKIIRGEGNASGHQGRLYALYSQAYINCVLALAVLRPPIDCDEEDRRLDGAN